MTSPDGSVDLRSDTVTVPNAEMRAAMADAPVGDDVYGEDPTVRRLEELAADRLGKQAALYTVTGTMANQLAIRVLARSGTEVLAPARAHVVRYEHAAAAQNAGVQMRGLADEGVDDGLVPAEAVGNALGDARHHLPTVSLVTLENTHMPASGRPWSASEVGAVVDAARAHGVPVHCDGARLFNAAVALGVPAQELVARVDTVMFCVSKGLGAPIGSLLCGSADVVAEARLERERLGGAWRQAGITAAAGIVALEHGVERLAEDHARALRLAVALAERFPGCVDPASVRTNIVCARLHRLPVRLFEVLETHDVRAGTIDARTARFVTHRDVDDVDLDRAIEALDAGVAIT